MSCSACSFSLLKPKTFFMYHQFNIQKFCVLPTMHLCVACISEQTTIFFLYTALIYRFFNRGRECFLRGTSWVFKLDRYSFVLKGFKDLLRLLYENIYS